MMDPTRADAVAAVGELTGTVALQRLHQAMQHDETGKIILQERPIVSKENIPYQYLLQSSQTILSTPSEDITFGQAYGAFLSKHGFDPDERDTIKYISDPDLAYVMLRYRQNHDFFHVLTDLPPTVLGELGLKWLELFQTGLPLAAFSGTIGSFQLDPRMKSILWKEYLPWATRVAQQMEFGALMMVYYEHEWETPLIELRQRLGVEPAPQIVFV
jgi:ubiquinone biosynthesis protein COQ4